MNYVRPPRGNPAGNRKSRHRNLLRHACDPEVCPRGYSWIPAGYDDRV